MKTINKHPFKIQSESFGFKGKPQYYWQLNDMRDALDYSREPQNYHIWELDPLTNRYKKMTIARKRELKVEYSV